MATAADLLPVLEELVEAMSRLGYSSRDVFCVRLAVEEAVINAIKHGHRYDPTKQVEIRYKLNQDNVLMEIEDEGPGFVPEQVADPTAQENLAKPSGRGLLLMQTFTTWMRYNARGNCLTFCKRLEGAGACS
jgi:serine/threonine-protein kinase RsbW